MGFLKMVYRNKIFFLGLWILLSFTSALAEQRLALVIGNAAYPPSDAIDNQFGHLDNPTNDADDMKSILQHYHFIVLPDKNHDLNEQEMKDAIKRFIRQLGKDDVGLFYYAGHGVQIQNTNYLIPTGRKFRDKYDVQYNAISANDLLKEMKGTEARLNIIILDACRSYMRAKGGRGLSGIVTYGLAEMKAEGTIIGYATAPGETAQDGEGGRNGPYTLHLIEAIRKKENLPIELVFKEAGKAVYEATNKEQRPWTFTDTFGDFCFGNCIINQLPKEEPTIVDEEKPESINEETFSPKEASQETIPQSVNKEHPLPSEKSHNKEKPASEIAQTSRKKNPPPTTRNKTHTFKAVDENISYTDIVILIVFIMCTMILFAFLMIRSVVIASFFSLVWIFLSSTALWIFWGRTV